MRLKRRRRHRQSKAEKIADIILDIIEIVASFKK